MNSTINHLLKRTAKIAVIVATFASFGVLASRINASADSPAIYNSPSGNKTSIPFSKTDSGLTTAQYFNLGDSTSNYAAPNGSVYGIATSILDVDKYISLSKQTSNPVLYEYIIINNQTDKDQTLRTTGGPDPASRILTPYQSIGFTNIPYFNNTVASQVVYAGDGSLQPTITSVGGESVNNPITMNYDFADGTTASTTDFPESKSTTVKEIDMVGTLKAGQTLTLKIPFKIVKKTADPQTAPTITSPSDIPNGLPVGNGQNNSATAFPTYNYNLSYDSGAANVLGIGLSEYANISTQSTTNDYYLTIKNSENSSEPASDIQDFTPKVNSDNELAIADFGQDTHTAAANDTYLYKGGSYSVNTSKMKNAKDSSQSFIDMLHSNGYAIPDNQTYIDFPADYTPSSEIASKLKTGDINLQVEKVIDAKGPITINTGSTWKPLDHVQILGTDGKKIDNAKVTTTKDNVNANVPGTYSVTYSYDYNGTPITKTIQVTVKGSSNNGGNGGGSSAGTVTTPTTNSGSTGTNTNGSTPSTTSPNTTSTIALPNYASKKGAAVYAVKAIYMYKHATFNKHQRVAKYPKQKRVNRPMFVITDYARSNGGALRYKVRDVNHHSKTAGKIGYITANSKYVVRVYYQSVPKNKKVTVIAKKGIHAYKNEALTGRTKSYKKGTRLTVKKLVKHNLTTRYELSNGSYITANKKFVIQGKY